MSKLKQINDCNILIVDDTKTNIDILVEALSDIYELSVATDGVSALEILDELTPDLILLDIMMPEMDGYEVIKRIKANPLTSNIPVIFLTALSDVQNKSLGFKLGAVDYITKPFEIEEVLARVKTHILLGLTQNELAYQNEVLEEKVRERTKELVLTQQAAIESMAALAEYRDPETGQHIIRVKEYVRLLANALKKNPKYTEQFTDKYIENLYLACPLHDIGKVGIPDNILLKPGKLTKEEFEEIKKHTFYGRNVILAAEKDTGPLPLLQIAKDVIYTHHEKWDGTGYPEGIKGEQIPISGRIMALADVYDALINKRVYKPAFSHKKAVDIILSGRGKHFDPEVVDIFLDNHEEFNKIALMFPERLPLRRFQGIHY